MRGGHEVSTADASRRAKLIRDAAEVALLGGGGEELAKLRVHVVVHPGLEEPIITDSTIDALGIQIVRFSKGLWRRANDPLGVVMERASPPEPMQGPRLNLLFWEPRCEGSAKSRTGKAVCDARPLEG